MVPSKGVPRTTPELRNDSCDNNTTGGDMSLIDQLQRVAAQINVIPTQLGLVAYQPVLVNFQHNSLSYTVPLTPPPRVERVKPGMVGAYITPAVEIFPGDLVVHEVTRVQIEPLVTAVVLQHGSYSYAGQTYKCVYLDTTSDDLFYTIYLRELRLTR